MKHCDQSVVGKRDTETPAIVVCGRETEVMRKLFLFCIVSTSLMTETLSLLSWRQDPDSVMVKMSSIKGQGSQQILNIGSLPLSSAQNQIFRKP